MRSISRFGAAAAALAAVAVGGAPVAAADAAVQPDPVGSVIYDRLVKNADGTFKTNGTGGYFAQDPYTDHAVTRKIGTLWTNGQCSASVLQTRTGAVAITARHCTDGDDALVNEGKVKFYPATHNRQNPYGEWIVDRVFTTETRVDGSVPDVAVLAIRPRDEGGRLRVVSDVTGGGLGIHPALTSTSSVRSTLIGYPGPAPYNGVTQAACVGDYTYYPNAGRGAIRRVSTQSECQIGGGSSGGPYVTATANGPQIITVLNSNGGSVIAGVTPGLVTEAEKWLTDKYPKLNRPSTGSAG